MNLDVNDQKRKFNHFLPIKIGKYECTALIDSRNIWRSTISEDFAKCLGITEAKPIQPAPRVTTAQQGVMVTMLGETPQPLKLTVRGTNKNYPFQPAIVRGLHTAVNLSGPWLKMQVWDDLYSQGCLSIEGHRIPLVEHSEAEPSVSGIFALQDLTIEARTGCNITALVPHIRGKQASPGLGCFEMGQRLHQEGVRTGPAVLTQIQQDGTAQLPIINMTVGNASSTLKDVLNMYTKCNYPSTEEGRQVQSLIPLNMGLAPTPVSTTHRLSPRTWA